MPLASRRYFFHYLLSLLLTSITTYFFTNKLFYYFKVSWCKGICHQEQKQNEHLYSCIQYESKLTMLAMLAVKRSVDVASEVNLRNPLCGGEKACKLGIHPSFDTPGRCHQKSKTGVSVVRQKGLVWAAIFKGRKQISEFTGSFNRWCYSIFNEYGDSVNIAFTSIPFMPFSCGLWW